MAQNNSPDRIESAANISLVISKQSENGVNYSDGSLDEPEADESSFIRIPISRLDTTKEVDISEIRESSLKANGYSVTSISYSGTMTFSGSRFTKRLPDSETNGDSTEPITDLLYNEHGVPVPFAININHELNDKPERYTTCLATSESYEVRSEEATETAFDWVSMDRGSDI